MALIESAGTFILSPSDLVASAECEYGWLRNIDIRRGIAPSLPVDEDPMAETIARLGDEHEARERDRRAREGTVLAIPRPDPFTRRRLEAAAEETRLLLTSSQAPDTVAQAAFFDGGFCGFADFLVRDGDAYAVWDVKLARTARVTAIVQIAAYAAALDEIGVPRSSVGHLRLGDHSEHHQPLDDVIPVYRHRRRHVERVLQRHLDEDAAVRWGDERYRICGHCAHCAAAIAEHDDLLQVAGLSRANRAALRAEGITTLADLAVATGPVRGISSRSWTRLHAQAALQERGRTSDDGEIPYEIFDPSPIAALPAPDPGDVFFDFEGDPLWVAPNGVAEGLEYLFGIVDLDHPDGHFLPLWAHDRAQEREALRRFFEYLAERRKRYPGMHVYHYAPYETSALKRLTVRHGLGEDELDDLLRQGIFVDLYATVRQSLRVAQPSYSIKKLEPLYMGDEIREADVTDALGSVIQYHLAVEAREAGDAAGASRRLDEIADYNRYDCISTWRLRDWLLAQVATREPAAELVLDLSAAPEPSRLSELQAVADGLMAGIPVEHADRTDEQQGVALLAAALGYYRREDKPMWWEYFDRCVSPPDEWLGARQTLIPETVEVISPWAKATPRAQTVSRTLRMVGELDVGTTLRKGTEVRCIYEDIPTPVSPEPGNLRAIGHTAHVTTITALDNNRFAVEIVEKTKKGWEEFPQLPMAVFEFGYIASGSLENAIGELAATVRETEPRALPADAAADILARRPPRLLRGTFDATGVDVVEPALLADALRAVDRSYVAVQGPPGTGKTHVGSRAVAELVAEGWKIGVVAQSHSVVEHFLNAVLKAGVPPDRIGKRRKSGATDEVEWTVLAKDEDLVHQDGGWVLGGTAWVFASPKVRDLDLLVIDEAGQFSLAHTVASSRAASRLLLLGDPQQLPQVSRGTHPEPVGTSALEWLVQDAHTMPPHLGFFLGRSWRMHSALTRRVSDLAYGGRLHSQREATDNRQFTGIAPGLHPYVVVHEGNDTVSLEEAEATVAIVEAAVRGTWRDSADDTPRPVTAGDVIVVAPYNAQVAAIRRLLDEAGFTDTQAGTVDRFQGREAPIAVVSMTASSAADAPRGLEFLLDRQRLNVAISRAQWATFIVHSPALLDSMPTSIPALERLGAFLRLADGEVVLGCA